MHGYNETISARRAGRLEMKMQGKATFMGHPIHPVLIPFPIAFFVGAFICDIISGFHTNPFWSTMSVSLIGFGIIGALLAAVFGFADYLTAPMSADAKRTATTHMLLNLVTVVIFVGAFLLRYDKPPSTAGYLLTVIGVIVLGVAGSLGGHLAYHFKVGVDEGQGGGSERSLTSSSQYTAHR